MHLWLRLKEKDFQNNDKILIILKGRLKSFSFSLDKRDNLKICTLRHWLMPQDNRVNNTIFLQLSAIHFGFFFISKVDAVTRKSKSTWTWMGNSIDFFFSDQNLLWLAFHVWFEIALGLNQKSEFSYAGWENTSREKNSCCLTVCSFSRIGDLFGPFLSVVCPAAPFTSSMNPHFCIVWPCRPWQGPAQSGGGGLLRLPLNWTASGKMGWSVCDKGLCIVIINWAL